MSDTLQLVLTRDTSVSQFVTNENADDQTRLSLISGTDDIPNTSPTSSPVANAELVLLQGDGADPRAAIPMPDGAAWGAQLAATLEGGRVEVAVIDTGIADYWTLVDAAQAAGFEVILLDADRDGVQQLAAQLDGYTDIDALHVFSHGGEGRINLGDVTLSLDTLRQYDNELAAIGRALDTEGDLLLYGCNVTAGSGSDFIDALADVTGADVAASDDLTGAADLGGDWNLEYLTGELESRAAFNPIIGGFSSLLASNTLNFSGAVPDQ